MDLQTEAACERFQGPSTGGPFPPGAPFRAPSRNAPRGPVFQAPGAPGSVPGVWGRDLGSCGSHPPRPTLARMRQRRRARADWHGAGRRWAVRVRRRWRVHQRSRVGGGASLRSRPPAAAAPCSALSLVASSNRSLAYGPGAPGTRMAARLSGFVAACRPARAVGRGVRSRAQEGRGVSGRRAEPERVPLSLSPHRTW